MSLTLTLVRHGESTDNLKSLWAGHRDAPLTTHGMNQARRLGKSFSSVPISKIYASDLKRAHWTALQIAVQNESLLNALEDGTAFAPSTSSGPPMATAGSTLENEGSNGLEGETEEEIAETEPGPSSLLSTDREGGASFDPMSGGAAPPPSASGSASEPSNAAAEYEDDFSCSSSAAASSPVRTSRGKKVSNASSSSSSSPKSAEERLSQTVSTTPLLREQFFGLAEGQNWKTGYATSSSSFHNRAYRFEGGESLEDVHARAGQIMQRCVLPWLVRATKEGRKEHVVLVAHGIMISELLYALSKLQDPRAMYERRSGHTNTGWTRLTLSLPSNIVQNPSELASSSIPHLSQPDLPEPYSSSAPAASTSTLPRISIRQTHTNITTHLNGLKRTKGGVGSEGFDQRQKSLKQFFSGSASEASAKNGNSGKNTQLPPSSDGAETTVDLTHSSDDDGDGGDVTLNDGDGLEDGKALKTNGEAANKRGIRLTSPPSPSPKKGRLT